MHLGASSRQSTPPVGDLSIPPQSQKDGDGTVPVALTSAIIPPSTDTSHVAPHPTPLTQAQVAQVNNKAGQAISSSQAAATHEGHASPDGATKSPKMLFSDLYKSTKSPLSRWRQHAHPVPSASPDYDADLLSRDKAKQKEAVKQYLSARIRNDWEFTWSPSTYSKTPHKTKTPADEASKNQSESPSSNDVDHLSVQELSSEDDDTASEYSVVSEDASHFRPRAEWWSDMSDDDQSVSPSAYRFDTPDAVGSVIKAKGQAKSAKIRRAVREEESWNSGLACFNARRDAWTSARTVRVKPKPQSIPTSPLSPRRLSLFRLSSPTSPVSPSGTTLGTSALSPVATQASGDTIAVSSSDADAKEVYPVETLLPVPPPLLPAANPMRASVTPAAYSSIYDRIIVHSMTPACPINLADVLRSCVVGWKRDGEWPPRSVEVPATVVAIRKKKRDSNAGQPTSPSGRRRSFGFMGRKDSAPSQPGNSPQDGHDDMTSKGIRKSIQRALRFGHERTASNASSHHGPAVE